MAEQRTLVCYSSIQFITRDILTLKNTLVCLAAFLALNLSLFANASTVCTRNKDCPEQNHHTGWQLGVALGVGARTNPLVDGDPVPLVLMPDIAYYSEYIYFDNGELGTRWSINADHDINLILSANRERAFFSFWQPANIFLPSINTGIPSIPTNDISEPPVAENNLTVSIDELDKRGWALDSCLIQSRTCTCLWFPR